MTRRMLSLLLLLSVLYSCEPKSTEENTDSSTEEAEEVSAETVAVCVWDQVSVRETPGPKTKYITALSVGETLTYLGEDSVVEERSYAKVKLNDEQEGWTLMDFLVLEAKPAVIVRETSIYSRPDLLTKKDLSFDDMDIVATTETQDDWIKVRGRRTGGKWMDEGWIKSDNLSYKDIDVATAKFAKKALELEESGEQIQALTELVENPDLNSSVFISALVVKLTELSEEGEEEVIEADSVLIDEE